MAIVRTIALAFGLLASTLFSQTGSPSATLGTARATAILRDGLADKNPDTRKQAVQGLGIAAARDPYLRPGEDMPSGKASQSRPRRI